MLEVRIHGRGGQGSVTLAELLAEAAFYSGQEAQAFPSFGVERRGAPVMAFVRLDNKPIRLRSQVYAPDYAIVQDPSLLNDEKLLSDLKAGAVVLVNTKETELTAKLPRGIRVKSLAATDIAKEVLGRPIINTIMLGAFAGLIGTIKMTAIEQAIRNRFSGELADKNIIAAKKGYEIISNN
ncbi:MAG: pyruvate ferredoxin oxidoreductase subunit gamma [Patescibacteria group bacterium]|jgi:pyruvate ferredoxin oxidoreductase gamma subunit